MKISIKKPVMTMAVILAASSLTGLPARAEMKAEPGKASHEYCEGKKHRDGYGHNRSSKEHWRNTLTGEQKTEMSRLSVSLKKELAPVKATIGLKRSEVKSILTSDSPDKAALGKLVEEMAALEKDVLRSKYEHMIKVRSLLTAEQKAMFDMAVLTEKEHERRHRR